MKLYNKLLLVLMTLSIPLLHSSSEGNKKSLLLKALATGVLLGTSIGSFLGCIQHDDLREMLLRGCALTTGVVCGAAAYSLLTSRASSSTQTEAPAPEILETDETIETPEPPIETVTTVNATPAEMVNTFTPVELSNRNSKLSDVAGTIPEDIIELVQIIKDSSKYTQIGATIPKGILLHGPGGTGKTSIARAIAGEANAAFFNISGSELNEVFIGLGAKRIRDLFQSARASIDSKQYQYAIIFIDEIDAVGGSRTIEYSSEPRHTLNELLNQMDGFNSHNDIFIIGATNSIKILDKALLRPGRFDKLVKIDLPIEADRLKILTHYSNKVQHTINDSCLQDIALQTNGCNGAELKSLINEAALNAVRNNHSTVQEEDCYYALNKILTQKQYR